MTTATATTTQTITNLMAAYEGESNATIKYTAFAIQAEVEGYLRAAALFRAAARAEQVHAAKHARVIAKLGGRAVATIHKVEVKSTRENLEAAKSGEEFEFTKMYPDFIAEAIASGNQEAVRSFEKAMKAEIVHAKLYGDALKNLEAQRTATTFYVCLHCGEVTDDPKEAENCPLCGAKKEKFLAVR